MTSLSTGRVMAIKGRSLSAEWRQVAPAEFHPFTAQTTTVFSTSSLQLSTNLRATRIARYHFKLLLFGLYGLPPPQSDFENPDLQPQSGTSRGRHSRLRCARGTNSSGLGMREPALKRSQTFNRPKPLSSPNSGCHSSNTRPLSIQQHPIINYNRQASFSTTSPLSKNSPYRAAEPKSGRQEDEPC